jgi:hypothetical protein
LLLLGSQVLNSLPQQAEFGLNAFGVHMSP